MASFNLHSDSEIHPCFYISIVHLYFYCYGHLYCYSILWIYLILFIIHFLINTCIQDLLVFATVNKASISISVQALYKGTFSFIFGKYLGMELLEYLMSNVSSFKREVVSFPKCLFHFTFSSTSVQEFSLFHVSARCLTSSTCYCQSF